MDSRRSSPPSPSPRDRTDEPSIPPPSNEAERSPNGNLSPEAPSAQSESIDSNDPLPSEYSSGDEVNQKAPRRGIWGFRHNSDSSTRRVENTSTPKRRRMFSSSGNRIRNPTQSTISREALSQKLPTLQQVLATANSSLEASLKSPIPENLLQSAAALLQSTTREIELLLSNEDGSQDNGGTDSGSLDSSGDPCDDTTNEELTNESVGEDGLEHEIGHQSNNGDQCLDCGEIARFPIWFSIEKRRAKRTKASIVAFYNTPRGKLRTLPPEEALIMDRDGRRKIPLLVQINSQAMVDFLNKVAGLTWMLPLILRPPFQLIVVRWGQLLENLEALRHKTETLKDAVDAAAGNELMEMQVELQKLQQRYHHFHTMMEFFQEELGSTLEVQEKLKNGTLKTINFENLWQLYQFGTVLIYKHDNQEAACQVFSTSGGDPDPFRRLTSMTTEDVLSPDEKVITTRQDPGPGVPLYPDSMVSCEDISYQSFTANTHKEANEGEYFAPLLVDCFFLDFNGTHVGPCQLDFRFNYFRGEKSIESLNAYPLRLHKATEDVKLRLKERGKQFVASYGHRTYDGLPLRSLDNIGGQIYVDISTGYKRIGWPNSRPAFGRLVRRFIIAKTGGVHAYSSDISLVYASERYSESLKAGLWQFVRPENSSLSEDSFLLMTYVVLGYSFQMRRWYYLDIDHISTIDKSESARHSGWGGLVIPPHYREMLVALVESHESGSRRMSTRREKPSPTKQIDLVRGKGNGLITLLHGPPGSGKTSTAETLAAYTKRPLYSITCGDIGGTAEEVEFNMQKHFDLASQWGCVLLLDEADVFLTKRDWNDVNRNGFVSVWLRILEYYSGILFITTNRVGVLDEAFKSRIHICLRYPALSLLATRLIWEKLLDKIERGNHNDSVKVEFDKDAILSFAERHFKKHAETKSTWNGRQIRNAIQTAISLGQHERLRRLRMEGMTEEDAERSGKKKYMQVELSEKNLDRIATTTTDFEHYMVGVRGSDVNMAKNESVRDDDYDEGTHWAGKQHRQTGIRGEMPAPPFCSSVRTRNSGHGAPSPWNQDSEYSYRGTQSSNKRKAPAIDESDSDS